MGLQRRNRHDLKYDVGHV